MLRRLYDRKFGDSYLHQPQPLGRCFTPGQLTGYYNDLTGKAKFTGPTTPGGAPLILSREGVLLELPVNTSQMALGLHDRWLMHGNEQDRKCFLRLAELFVAQAHRTEHGLVWLYDFDLPLYGLRRPWISAMAQGQVISVLVRARQLTNDDRYLDAARAAAGPFRVEVDRGGVGRSTEHGWWLEEYPSTPPSLVLNGFIFALWGLYDLGLAGDDDAASFFRSLSRTIAATLPVFDVHGWSRYDRYPSFLLPNLASPFYQRLHVAQLDAMWQLTAIEAFATFRDRWAAADANATKTSAAIAYKAAVRAERATRRWVSRARRRPIAGA